MFSLRVVVAVLAVVGCHGEGQHGIYGNAPQADATIYREHVASGVGPSQGRALGAVPHGALAPGAVSHGAVSHAVLDGGVTHSVSRGVVHGPAPVVTKVSKSAVVRQGPVHQRTSLIHGPVVDSARISHPAPVVHGPVAVPVAPVPAAPVLHAAVAPAPVVAAPVAHAPVVAAPVAHAPVAPYGAVQHAPVVSQYHSQNELGQYSFGYNAGTSSRDESRDAYGNVRGSFSYVDPYGNVQRQDYVADDYGFRVAGTNLPVHVTANRHKRSYTATFPASTGPLGAGLQTVANAAPVHAVAAPVHAVASPVHAVAAPVHAVAAPVHAVAAPVHAVAAPVHAVAPAVQAVSHRSGPVRAVTHVVNGPVVVRGSTSVHRDRGGYGGSFLSNGNYNG